MAFSKTFLVGFTRNSTNKYSKIIEILLFTRDLADKLVMFEVSL